VNFDSAFLIVGIVVEVVLVCVLISGKAYKTLPLFCVYTAWGLLLDASNAILLAKLPEYYWKIYLFELIPDAAIQFGVLIELAWSILRPVRTSLPRGTIFILAGLVALAGLVIWPLATLTLPPNLSVHAQLFVHFQQTIAILRVVCFLVLAGFSQVLSIGWKDRELQAATGLGFFSIVSLLVAVLHSHQSPLDPAYTWLDRSAGICYFGTLTYWVICFATKEQQRKEFSPQMQQLLVLMSGGARAGRIALGDIPPQSPRKRIK